MNRFVFLLIELHMLFFCGSSLVFIHLLSRIADAEENLGESEVREAHLAKSLYYIRISDKVDK